METPTSTTLEGTGCQLNLDKHVRVHHPEKDSNDDTLKEVLSQRTETQGKTRIRRTNTGLTRSPRSEDLA